MKIYLSHSTKYDYINKIYNPIKQSNLWIENEFLFPHDGDKIKNSKEIISNCDLVIAEVSVQSTGQGIELGWAEYANIPVVCIYEKGNEVSSSIKFITNNIIEYNGAEDMISKISNFFY